MTYTLTHNSDLTTAEVAQLFTAAQDAGIAEAVFYSGGTHTPADWLEFCRSQTTWIFRCDHSAKGLCGFIWLNGFEGVGAKIHLCLWGIKMVDMLELGELISRTLYDMGLWGVYAIFPVQYRHIAKLSRLFGFRVVGDVPHACYMQRRGAYVTGRFVTLDLIDKYGRI